LGTIRTLTGPAMIRQRDVAVLTNSFRDLGNARWGILDQAPTLAAKHKTERCPPAILLLERAIRIRAALPASD